MSDENNEWDYQTGGASDFLKIAEGQKVTLRIVSETHHRYTVQKGKELVDTRDWGDEQWERAKNDSNYQLKDRFVWGVWSRDDKRAYIFEVGPQVYNQVKTLATDPEYGDPRKYDIKIERQGSNLDTKYSVLPGKNDDPVGEEEEQQVYALDIQKIVKGAKKLVDHIKEMQSE